MKKLNKKRMKSFSALLMAFLLICIPFYGCQESVENLTVDTTVTGDYPVTVNGVEFASQPQKILVLSPSLADIVLALGCERYLTAASAECTQSDLEVLPKISSTDIQAISDTGADLILIEPLNDETRQSYENLGIQIFEVQTATTRENFESLYTQMGTALLGDGYGYDVGLEISRDIFITLDTISRETQRDTITTACYLYDTEGNAITGDTFGSLILEYAGLTNIFTSENGGTYSMDTLNLSNPDMIFCDIGVKDQILSHSDFSNLAAVRTGQVYELDKNYMERQGRTVILGTSEVASLAFPELLEDVSQEVPDPTSKIESAVETEMSEQLSDEDEAQTEYTELSHGDSGDDVYALQERLTELGYLDTDFDGEFGNYTEEAVENFQRENGLTETGIADPATQQKLFSDDAVAKP